MNSFNISVTSKFPENYLIASLMFLYPSIDIQKVIIRMNNCTDRMMNINGNMNITLEKASNLIIK